MQELEQIEAAIRTSQQWIVTLQGRRELLTSELERLTRPQIVATTLLNRTVGPGFVYRGEMCTYWCYIDIHIALLRRLWADFPHKREQMARAMGAHGTTRAYVAQSRDDLFPGQPVEFVQRHSCLLIDGWWVDKNLNRERMQTVLPTAVRAAGLTLGKDITIIWRRMHIHG
jgi:hypothetical protein